MTAKQRRLNKQRRNQAIRRAIRRYNANGMPIPKWVWRHSKFKIKMTYTNVVVCDIRSFNYTPPPEA